MPKRVWSGVIGSAAVLIGLSGCVSQRQYDQLQDAYYAQKDQNTSLVRELEQTRESLDLIRGTGQETEGALSRQQQRIRDLEMQLAESNKLLEMVDSELRNLGLVDAQFDQALRDLAAQYSNVIVYDPERGMLRFRSDLTFNSGSDQVRDGARQALSSLANVIRNDTNLSYELQIVGHTDSEPISSGTAQRHPTNTHLSVHRAIAVKQALVSLGVPAQRVLVAGWGEYRPTVPNTPSGNTPQNRRVEIFFRPESDEMSTATVQPVADDPAGTYIEPTK